jgi:hypothetical protein
MTHTSSGRVNVNTPGTPGFALDQSGQESCKVVFQGNSRVDRRDSSGFASGGRLGPDAFSEECVFVANPEIRATRCKMAKNTEEE